MHFINTKTVFLVGLFSKSPHPKRLWFYRKKSAAYEPYTNNKIQLLGVWKTMDKILEQYKTEGKIKMQYQGIIEIFPQKFLNTFCLNKFLLELQKDYELIQIFPGLIRAFKK